MSQEELDVAFDHVLALGGLVDAAFAGQAAAEIDTLQWITERTFSKAQATTLHDRLHHSLGGIFAGISHPRFATVALALSAKGAAKLGIEGPRAVGDASV
jgi:hypothetical protein